MGFLVSSATRHVKIFYSFIVNRLINFYYYGKAPLMLSPIKISSSGAHLTKCRLHQTATTISLKSKSCKYK